MVARKHHQELKHSTVTSARQGKQDDDAPGVREDVQDEDSHFGRSTQSERFFSVLHPCQTTRHASQRMVISPDSGRIVSGHPRSTSQGSTRSAVAIFFWWAVASCETREAAGSTETATWAGHTRHESRRGVGSSSFQGTALGEGHRSSGGQRFSRTTVADICTRTSPSRSSGPTRSATSRRMSSFHSTIETDCSRWSRNGSPSRRSSTQL